MAKFSVTCPDSHIWYIVFKFKLSLELKCRYCGTEVKVVRVMYLTPTVYVDQINANPVTRKDPTAYLQLPEHVFAEKQRRPQDED